MSAGRCNGLDDALPEVVALEYSGLVRRFFAALVDGAIGIAALPIAMWTTRISWEHRTLVPVVLRGLFWLAFDVFFIVKWGGTPGKLLLGIRIVDRRGRFISVKAALLRYALWMVHSAVSLAMMLEAWALIPVSEMPHGYWELARLARAQSSACYQLLSAGVACLCMVDVAAILLNQKKRAIHDFLAGSYVVTKRSHEMARPSGHHGASCRRAWDGQIAPGKTAGNGD